MSREKRRSEIESRASFEHVRYAQVWEDADTLLAALDVQQGDTVLSIASAGDNALALMTTDAAKVVAVDLSAAQLHCLALRVAAFQVLSHPELLELIGSRPSKRRLELYRHCRTQLLPDSRAFWDALAQLDGDQGARRVLQAHRPAWCEVPCDDPGVLRDVDTPAALG